MSRELRDVYQIKVPGSVRISFGRLGYAIVNGGCLIYIRLRAEARRPYWMDKIVAGVKKLFPEVKAVGGDAAEEALYNKHGIPIV